MASSADISHQDTTLGTTPAGRIFKSFRLWLAVPASDLLRLRHVLEHPAEAERLDVAQELLLRVDAEPPLRVP